MSALKTTLLSLKIAILMVLVTVLGAFLILGAFFWYYFGYEPFHGLKFDQKIWLQSISSGDIEKRCHMSSDIIESHLTKGMAREEVVALLGKPMQPMQPESGAGYISYVIGSCSSLDINTLDIYFDRENRLTQAATVQH